MAPRPSPRAPSPPDLSEVALVASLATLGLVLGAAPALLRLYVGGGSAAAKAGVIPGAASYVRIRALSFPAALVGNVLQARARDGGR